MKYKNNSLESEIVNAIYDSLAGNNLYPKFKSENIDDGFIDSLKGELEFNYKIDEAYIDGEIQKIEPKAFNIQITVDVFPTEG